MIFPILAVSPPFCVIFCLLFQPFYYITTAAVLQGLWQNNLLKIMTNV
jgi:hypothetical protein